MAAANGHLPVVKYLILLLEKDDVKQLLEAKNENGNTALHWASYNGHLEVVEYLVEEVNADPFIKTILDMIVFMKLNWVDKLKLRIGT